MKKRFPIYFAALVALVSLTSCQTGKSVSSSTASRSSQPAGTSASSAYTYTGGKATISYMYWGAETEAAVRKGAATSFNGAQSDITVKPIFVSSDNYMAKLQAYFAANNAPDVIQSSGNFGDPYIKAGKIEDLTPYIKRDNLMSAWNQLLVDNFTYDGKIYSAPMIYNSFYIIYNKNLFDQAGVSYPSNDWTEEEFLQKAKALTKGSGTNKQYGIRLSWLPPIMLPEMYGSPVFDVQKNKAHFSDNKAFIDSFKYLTDLALKEEVAPDAAGESAAGTGFVSGKFAMELSALWDLKQINKTVGDAFKFDIVKLPISKTYGRWKTPVANVGFYISANSAYKDAAWEFIKYATTDTKVQNTMGECGIPAALSVTSAANYLTTYPEGFKPFDKTVVQKLSDAVIWPTDVGTWGKLVTELNAKYSLVMNKKATVDQVVADLQKTADTELAKAN